MSAFEIFPRDGEHKPTYCVWEMAAVMHEKTVWEKFLRSTRDRGAAKLWVEDVYSGAA
ncbi:MAG: hypothetical protein WBD22_08795 [Pyrinomonadaceae bacterium]